MRGVARYESNGVHKWSNGLIDRVPRFTHAVVGLRASRHAEETPFELTPTQGIP